ncbi:S8 family serine peptidase [Candidatus Dojkabacteria bacterium]|nr:S8 family serine peptidase [Candidatus Dojkabacteria bacterium]
MLYETYLGRYKNIRTIGKKYKRSMSFILLAVLAFGLILNPLVTLPAGASQTITAVGTDKLKNPDYYPKKTENLIAKTTEIIGLDSEITPAQVFEFEKETSGFYFTLRAGENFSESSFKVEYPSGEISDEYLIQESDVYFGEDSSTSLGNRTSELYLFNQGVTKVLVYCGSDTEFEIHQIGEQNNDFEDSLGLTQIKAFSSTPAETTYKEALFSNMGFNIITREEWGAPTESGWGPTIADVNRIVIHHTATSVDMSNPKNTVKAIYDYHKIRCNNNIGTAPTYCDYADTWQDIGYNYLIDPYGNVYEGRAGGNGVVGAHAIPNTGSIGISILGDYSNQVPTSASLNALSTLMARLSLINNFSLTKGSSVLGHRDVNATACPGNAFYSKLSTVTSNANQIRTTASTAKTANTKINDYLAPEREYIKKDGKTQLIVDTTGLSLTMIEKLSTVSRGIDEITEIDNGLIYTVDDAKADQVIGETYVAASSTKIQPDFIYRLESWDNTDPDRSIPSDYDVSTHWNLEKTNTPEAWKDLGGCTGDDSCGGDSSVIVAVLDTGVAYEDFDFDAGGTYSTTKYSGLWIDVPGAAANGTYNEGYDRQFYQLPELAGVNFVDPYDPAWDLLCSIRTGGGACNATELAKIDHPNDDNGHGTFVTTIIAGDTGDTAPNKVVGIAHNVSIMPVKVMLPNDRSMCQTAAGALDLTCADYRYDYRSVGTTSTIVAGIEHAVDNGADVINMSLGGEGTDSVMEAAVDAAVAAGAIVVVSSGNENDDIANYFPASFNNVIAVGATNTDDSRSSYTNYGEELDISAPVGTTIRSRTLNCYPSENDCSNEATLDFSVFSSESTPKTSSGTSFAAPQVSAAVALLKSYKPFLNYEMIKALLYQNSTDIGTAGKDNLTGWGLLDIEASLIGADYAFPASSKWHDWFAPYGEVPEVGDFNHDGYDDIVTFTSDGWGDVWIALNNSGTGFNTSSKWHDWFAPYDEIPAVGDFNDDGYDDIITFTSDGWGDVWVALNDQAGGFDTATKWHDWFAPFNEIPRIGDFNGDGYDDIATFTSDGWGDVWIALNNQTGGFNTATKWHDWFAPFDEIPAVGDFNNDSYDDIATFTSDGWGDVWVALNSQSSSFNTSTKWHDWFAPYDEIPAIMNFDGDTDLDIVTFTSDGYGDVWLATSDGGTGFNPSHLAHYWFAPFNEIPKVGDFDGDGKDDLATFTNDSNWWGDVWVSINQN